MDRFVEVELVIILNIIGKIYSQYLNRAVEPFQIQRLISIIFPFPQPKRLPFKDRPAILPKSPTIFKALSNDSMSTLNRVVSSANWDSLIS